MQLAKHGHSSCTLLAPCACTAASEAMLCVPTCIMSSTACWVPGVTMSINLVVQSPQWRRTATSLLLCKLRCGCIAGRALRRGRLCWQAWPPGSSPGVDRCGALLASSSAGLWLAAWLPASPGQCWGLCSRLPLPFLAAGSFLGLPPHCKGLGPAQSSGHSIADSLPLALAPLSCGHSCAHNFSLLQRLLFLGNI